MKMEFKRVMPNYSEDLANLINAEISQRLMTQAWIEKNMKIEQEVQELF